MTARVVIFCFIGFLGIPNEASSQTLKLSGTLTDGYSLPVAGATVELHADVDYRTTTDATGVFLLSGLPHGTYKLSVIAMGFEPAVLEVTLANAETIITHKMVATTQQLDEVTVESMLAQRKVAPIKAEIITLADKERRATNLADIMTSAVGVRIKQSGGLGSNTTIQINGFQGNSIKMFRDGIPLDYLGGVMGANSLNTIPTGMLSSVEVYKGVLPGHISADALGGAINLVSKPAGNRSLSLAYEVGAFSTQRITLNAYYKRPSSHWFAGTDGYFNYSKNNYSVSVDVADPETANLSRQRIKLFHNGYRSYFIEAYGGLQDLSWADELRITLATFDVDRDVQFGARMANAYGALTTRSDATFIPSLRYKKQLAERFSIDQFLVYSRYHVYNTDTLRGRYDWYGQFSPYTDHRIGEVEATLSDVTFRYFISRTALAYQVNDRNTLQLNTVYTAYRNVGEDPYGALTVGQNRVPIISLPSTLGKLASTVSWQANLGTRFENIVQVKVHHSRAGSARMDDEGQFTGERYVSDQAVFGASEALKYTLSDRAFVRGAVERAIRMPDPVELFGNGTRFSLPNPTLKPEVSYNFILGAYYRSRSGGTLEANAFYRRSRNMIYNAPDIRNPLFSQSQNVSAVGGLGLELEAAYPVSEWLRLFGNATYQSFRKTELNENEWTQPYLLHARVGNIPYAFANLGALVPVNNVLVKGDRLQLYWNFSYVHMYFLRAVPKDAEPDGFLGLWGKPGIEMSGVIPSYGIHHAGATWSLSQVRPLSVGLELRNIFNEDYYDNFRIQNPGRSWNVKLMYHIN